ncbi:MAG: DUF692 domain-containing protein [Verrucomicrobia bacterium]|nr:DUF692 domain-containing protein [Verrucomicrobiota bacterium]
MNVGLGYRRELSGWIETRPRGVDCLEITAEHFGEHAGEHLAQLGRRYRLFVHGLGLSLGTPGPMDAVRVEHFASVVRMANPAWISEHVAFTRTAEVDLGHLNPVPLTRESLRVLADNARRVADHCGKPMLLENITSHLKLEGELSETDFLNELCVRADCGLLLDVTNLFINSRNHGFDPVAWLHEIEPSRIRQLHLVGYSRQGDRYTDSHAKPIQDDLIELATAVVRHAPVEAIILERDEDIPESNADLEVEIAKLERIAGRR